MAKELLQKTKYTLFSNRTLFPEKYPYPRGSIEAKRQLLISLSPMLTDAEKSRQKDSTVCERITGCKSVKVKTRYSSYEYTDTATNTVITPEEFEHRYLAYLDQTTPSRVLRLAAIATQASSSDRALATECSSSQSDSTCEDEDVLMFPMDSPPSMNSQPVVIQEVVSDAPLIQNTEDATTDALDTSVCSSISRGHRSRTKRMTLSPKSARDMLLLAASEDEATAETPAVLDTITSSSSSTSPAQADTSVCQSTSAPVPEYSVPASFDPFADEEDTTMNSRAARSKRMTLSPSSARRMLSLSVEEDELNSSSLSECSDSSSSVSLTEAEAVHPVTKPIVVEESVTSPISTSTVVDRDAKVVADFSSELEAILADGPSNDLMLSVKFTVFPRASFSSPAPTPPVIMSVFPDIDVANHSFNTAISPVKSVVGTSLVSPATITTVSSKMDIIAPSIPIIITAADIVPVDTRAPEDFRYEATSRLYARYSQARWRYQWEVVSFEAVVRARDRLFLRFASKN